MSAASLSDLGWTADRDAELAPYAALGLVAGRVSLEHNHVLRVMTEGAEQLAETSGRVKHLALGRHELPVVGDWVVVRPDPSGQRVQIRGILPRRSWFSRKAAGRETTEQVVAANIDTVLVVFGLDMAVNARAIERYLVVASRSGAAPVIVLNKADLVDDLDAAVAAAAAIAGDAPVIGVSTRTGQGVAALEARLAAGRTLALLGPSGAGKSTIVNRLVGHELLPTGEVRAWDARGRHTSVHRQLVVRATGGLIIDTPGMRELQLWDTDSVNDAFTDIADLGASCRFRDCRHDREPGCAVKAGVDAGVLDPARYQGFLKLQAEQAEIEQKRDARSQAEAKRAGKIGQKAMRALDKDREPGDR